MGGTGGTTSSLGGSYRPPSRTKNDGGGDRLSASADVPPPSKNGVEKVSLGRSSAVDEYDDDDDDDDDESDWDSSQLSKQNRNSNTLGDSFEQYDEPYLRPPSSSAVKGLSASLESTLSSRDKSRKPVGGVDLHAV